MTHISSLRTPVAPPHSIVDKSGQAAFGTFDREIVNLNFGDCVRPFDKDMSQTMQNFKLTQWEATEIVTDDHAIVTAVYSMGKIGFGLIVVFDRKNHTIKSYFKPSTSKKLTIAPNLIDTVTKLQSYSTNIKMENNMHTGKAHSHGYSHSKSKGNCRFDCHLSRLSPASIVCIPFGKNMPLYSQKDFFKADGFIELAGNKIFTNENSVAIIDDHKGYYPRSAHYDWLTSMGRMEHDGKQIYAAFNLTRNQSIDQDNYNENVLWLEDRQVQLPPVQFQKSQDIWHVYDQYGMVDLSFIILNTFKMVTNIGVYKVEYYLPFGKLSGFIKDENGEVYKFDNMIGIGEDKTTLI